MMRKLYFISAAGFLDGDIEVSEDLPANAEMLLSARGRYTDVAPQKKLKVPYWSFGKWEEGFNVALRMQKDDAIASVNAAAELRLGLSMTPARAMIYSEKAAEARAWMESPSAPTPLIDAELSATKESKSALVKKIIEKDDYYWREVRRTEGLRRKAKLDIEAAKSMEDVQKVQQDFLAALNQQ